MQAPIKPPAAISDSSLVGSSRRAIKLEPASQPASQSGRQDDGSMELRASAGLFTPSAGRSAKPGGQALSIERRRSTIKGKPGSPNSGSQAGQLSLIVPTGHRADSTRSAYLANRAIHPVRRAPPIGLSDAEEATREGIIAASAKVASLTDRPEAGRER